MFGFVVYTAMFVGVVMFFCAMSLLLSVLVLSLHHRSPKTHHMPNWVRHVSLNFGMYFELRCKNTLMSIYRSLRIFKVA